MSFFEWKERMSVGDDMVDSDHQKLIGYLNEMHEAMIAGRGKQVVGEILDKLVAYTKDTSPARKRSGRVATTPESSSTAKNITPASRRWPN